MQTPGRRRQSARQAVEAADERETTCGEFRLRNYGYFLSLMLSFFLFKILVKMQNYLLIFFNGKNQTVVVVT
jgi:hypothetical protein